MDAVRYPLPPRYSSKRRLFLQDHFERGLWRGLLGHETPEEPKHTPRTERAAKVGSIWTTIGDGPRYSVHEIKDVGENPNGQWPRVIRDVFIVEVGKPANSRYSKWIREKTLLCFYRPAEEKTT